MFQWKFQSVDLPFKVLRKVSSNIVVASVRVDVTGCDLPGDAEAMAVL